MSTKNPETMPSTIPEPTPEVAIPPDVLRDGPPSTWSGTTWGTDIAEPYVRASLNLEPASDDPWYFDALLPDGTKVEIKVCRVFVGDDRERGRWWIGRDVIQELTRQGAYIALAVYDPDVATREDPFRAFTNLVLKPAAWVESRVRKWYDLNGHEKSDSAGYLYWSEVFTLSEVLNSQKRNSK